MFKQNYYLKCYLKLPSLDCLHISWVPGQPNDTLEHFNHEYVRDGRCFYNAVEYDNGCFVFLSSTSTIIQKVTTIAHCVDY